jgi:hypothetical protein
MSLVIHFQERQRYATRYFRLALKVGGVLLAYIGNKSRRRAVFYPAFFVLKEPRFDRDIARHIKNRSKFRGGAMNG